ncbi:LLM class flavin-dependent oxidoreductase [Nonomuraea sp. NPDC049269]|uniref:LLM class flavin-dependent oxidoreductase n=1 Tax=Nonomuraea sp. NPDC049269 TaxID=3364349 RepID=UPI0037131A59
MIGIGLPQIRDDLPVRAAELTTFVSTAEQVGFDSVWVAEAPWTQPSLDPFAALAVAATRSTRLRLGTAVLVPLNYPPVLFARAVASIDVLAGGRLTLGIGVGEPAVEASEPLSQRADRFEHLVGDLRHAWGHGSPDPGRPRIGVHAVGGSIPMVIGARAGRALRRAARVGDGWVCSAWADIDGFVAQRAVVDAERQASGCDATEFRYIKRCYVAIEQRAHDVESWFHAASGSEAPGGGILLRGSADAVEVQLRRLKDAGADELILQFVGIDERRQMEVLAASGALSRLAGGEGGKA